MADLVMALGDMLFQLWLTSHGYRGRVTRHIMMLALHFMFFLRYLHTHTSHAFGHCIWENETCTADWLLSSIKGAIFST